MPQATLLTSRLVLVPLSDEHLDDEVALDADPEVMRHLDAPRSRPVVEQAHARRLAAVSGGLGFWAGLRAGTYVGWWLLEPVDAPGEAELGYRLHRRFWRQGLASEGSRELLRHGFDDLGLDRIFAQTMAVNTGSRATMASIGLTCVRTFHVPFDAPLDGAEQGEVEYAISRAEWPGPAG